jgi:hypothetical protein
MVLFRYQASIADFKVQKYMENWKVVRRCSC